MSKSLWRKKSLPASSSKQAAEDALAGFRIAKGGIPDDVPENECDWRSIGIAHLLKQTGLCTSTSEAIRMIDQNGVRIDGNVVSNKQLQIQAGTMVLQVGKKAQIHESAFVSA